MLTYGRPAPRKRVVALGYDRANDDAPKVVATGQGPLADQILKLARENGVPIKEDPVLATTLATLDLEETIPPELYAVVAEVLIYVWRVRERRTRIG